MWGGIKELINPENINNNIHDLSAANLFLSNYLKTVYRVQNNYIDGGVPAGRMFECDAASALGMVAPMAILKETAPVDGWVDNPNSILTVLSKIVSGAENVNKNGTTIRQYAISGEGIKYEELVPNPDHRVSQLLNKTFASC